MREMPFEATLAQVQGLRGEIQASKRKTLLELFVSSFAVFFWVSVSFFEKMHGGIFVSLLIFPLIINATMWAFWVVFRGVLFPFSYRYYEKMEVDEMYSSDEDIRALYKEYEVLRYSLHRERRIERYIDLLTAIQFILMAVILAFSLARLFG